jgi:hypothetical protein
MFLVSEAAAIAVRDAFEKDGELSAAVELRRWFPGITDNEGAGLRPDHRGMAAAARGGLVRSPGRPSPNVDPA